MLNTAEIQNKKWWKEIPEELIHKFKEGDIVCSDALTFLNNLKSGIADIIFLDPPFNLGKKYGNRSSSKDKLDENEYFDYLVKILESSCRVLRKGGAIYLYHIPKWAIRLSNVLINKLEFRHWIAIIMKNGFVRRSHLYPAHYALLYFTKGKPGVFNRPKIDAQKCRNCGDYIKDYGGYKKFIEDGINLSDVWDDISPVRHKKYKNRNCNELPLSISKRIIEISGKKKGIVVDPFAGTGSTLVVAMEKGMNFVACDIEEEFCKLMYNRLLKCKGSLNG